MLTLVPNPGYYDAPRIKLTEIDIPFVGDSAARQGYDSGAYQVIYVAPSSLATARVLPDFHSSPVLGIDYLSYDVSRPPFNNKDLRLALSYAINRDLINENVLHGVQRTIYSMVPDGIQGYDSSANNRVPYFSMARARQYLTRAKAEMGANFPSSMTITYQNDGLAPQEYAELQNEWRQLGVNVIPVGISFSDWFKRVTKPDTSLSYAGASPAIEGSWYDDYPDANDFTKVILSSTSVYNVGNYDSPVFDTLVTQAETASTSLRPQLYSRASRTVLNDAAVSLIGQGTTNWRWSSNVSGLALWPAVLLPTPLNNDWTNVDVQ